MSKILSALLSKALGMDETAVASLYNEDGTEKDEAADLVLKLDQDRIASVTKKNELSFDNGYKKAQSEVLSKFEGQIREEFGVNDSEYKGIELIKNLISSNSGKKSELTRDELLKSRLFLDEKERLTKELNDSFSGKVKEFEDFKKGIERKEVLHSVRSFADSIFSESGAVLPQDSKRATNQKNLFFNSVLEGNFRIEKGDSGEVTNVFMLDDEGNDKLDGHGNRIKFADLVKSKISDFFDIQTATPRNSPGGDPDKKDNSQSKMTFKDESDYTNQVQEALKDQTPTGKAKVAELFKAWEEQSKSV